MGHIVKTLNPTYVNTINLSELSESRNLIIEVNDFPITAIELGDISSYNIGSIDFVSKSNTLIKTVLHELQN